QQKSPGTRPGASMLVAVDARSVLRDDRAAELVVDAGGDEIDVRPDAIGAEEGASRRDEGVGTVLHEQVIVFDADRPVRSEGVFEADADRAAPAGVVTGDGGEHIGAGKERTVF